MRKLQTTDLFKALRLVKSANLREELKPVLIKASKTGVQVKDIGIEAFITIIEAFASNNAEEKFYEFLSEPLEKDIEEIKNMGLMELYESLKELAKVSDLQAFFTVLSNMMG